MYVCMYVCMYMYIFFKGQERFESSMLPQVYVHFTVF